MKQHSECFKQAIFQQIHETQSKQEDANKDSKQEDDNKVCSLFQKHHITYPSILIILLSRSNSEAPGNKGSPRNNSATMHPNDHISMAVVYLGTH